jgi:hypothetical protein
MAEQILQFEVLESVVRVSAAAHLLVCLCEHHPDGSYAPMPLRSLKAALPQLADSQSLGVVVHILGDDGLYVPLTLDLLRQVHIRPDE